MNEYFKKFCAIEKTRYDLTIPFVQDGYLYATDGRIMIRVPCKDGNTEGRFPRGEVQYTSLKAEIDIEIEKPKKSGVPCGDCHGLGIMRIDCHDCGNSTKVPGVNCDVCGGDGVEYDHVIVDGVKFNSHYMNKIVNNLENPHFVLLLSGEGSESKDRGFFTFGENGQGILIAIE